jgi:hypothetical protein
MTNPLGIRRPVAMQYKEIWIIGTDPPCPRCGYLTTMVYEVVDEMGLNVQVRHLAYTGEEAQSFAKTMGLTPGTAKDVAIKGNIPMDWDRVYALVNVPVQASNQSVETCCPASGTNWTPELDKILFPCEEKAANLGIMMTPVLVADGRLLHQGSVPDREKVRDWLSEFLIPSDSKRVVEILGPGCQNCDTVYRNTFKALKNLGLKDKIMVVKKSDLDYFLEKNVHITPGLIIDGTVVSKGKVLKVEQIEILLQNEI